jgi:oligopeptide transport system substrate-binding protein
MKKFYLCCGIGFSIFAIILFSMSSNQVHTEGKMKSPHSGSLKINLLDGDPPSLHPHFVTDLRGRSLLKNLFEGLTRVNEKDQVEMAGAEKVEVSSDNVYTFTLRPHTWSNGKPVTAYHYEATWKRALSPHGLCQRADLFYVIKNAREVYQGKVTVDQLGVKALNNRTLVVELAQPAPYFLNLLSTPVFSPLFDDAKEPQIFNGPFVLGSWKRDIVLKFARNPNYWDANKVHLQEIVFSMIKDPAVALSFFDRGETDYIGVPFSELPLEALSSKTYEGRINSKEVARTFWVNINVEKPPMNSTKIRQALSCVLDRESLTDHIFIGQLPHKSPIPKNLSLLTEEEMYQDGDQISALRLFDEGLKELGLTRETCPPLCLIYCDYPGHKSLAEALQQIWQTAFGINVELEGCEWNVFSVRLEERQYQLGGYLCSSWYSDPLHHLEIFKDKNYFMNVCAWENDTYKQILNLAITNDEKQRMEQLKKAEKFLLEEMPVIPVFASAHRYMTHDKLSGLVINKSGELDLKTAHFK